MFLGRILPDLKWQIARFRILERKKKGRTRKGPDKIEAETRVVKGGLRAASEANQKILNGTPAPKKLRKDEL